MTGTAFECLGLSGWSTLVEVCNSCRGTGDLLVGVAPHALAGDLHLPRSTMDMTVLGNPQRTCGFDMHLGLTGSDTKLPARTVTLWTLAPNLHPPACPVRPCMLCHVLIPCSPSHAALQASTNKTDLLLLLRMLCMINA